jgi:hypothetical protein
LSWNLSIFVAKNNINSESIFIDKYNILQKLQTMYKKKRIKKQVAVEHKHSFVTEFSFELLIFITKK